jgi:Zn ribbon nucleic-acid-binding protein
VPWVEDMAQMVECLPSKHETLSSNTTTTKKKKKKERKKERKKESAL